MSVCTTKKRTRVATTRRPKQLTSEPETLASRFDEEHGDFARTLSLLPGDKAKLSEFSEFLSHFSDWLCVGKKGILEFIELSSEGKSLCLYLQIMWANRLLDSLVVDAAVIGMNADKRFALCKDVRKHIFHQLSAEHFATKAGAENRQVTAMEPPLGVAV